MISQAPLELKEIVVLMCVVTVSIACIHTKLALIGILQVVVKLSGVCLLYCQTGGHVYSCLCTSCDTGMCVVMLTHRNVTPSHFPCVKCISSYMYVYVCGVCDRLCMQPRYLHKLLEGGWTLFMNGESGCRHACALRGALNRIIVNTFNMRVCYYS